MNPRAIIYCQVRRQLSKCQYKRRTWSLVSTSYYNDAKHHLSCTNHYAGNSVGRNVSRSTSRRSLMTTNTNITNSNNQSKQTPVVIIGGGPTGLCLSIFLSQYNIPSTLIEARTIDEIHQHPQAHYLNLRTMEILRHSMPNVYEDVLNAMSPVDEWEGFTFSHSILGRQIARVVHPVRGVKVGQDGNGILVRDDENRFFYDDDDTGAGTGDEVDTQDDSCHRISICNPGHLAQNKFSKILLQEAKRASNLVPGSQIIHSDKVERLITSTNNDNNSEPRSFPFHVHTSTGNIFEANYIIAADGSASPTRMANDNGLGMTGNSSMQHLINVHFRTSTKISNQLKEREEIIGMLHFVFNQNLVGAFVCHDLNEGDWVLQIPFFPPFQDWNRYNEDIVRSIVLSGLGVVNDFNDGESYDEKDIQILSIKPWAMAATVAPTYFVGELDRIILAGDAAHAFPPAGGFGMNTGIQDAHNLAWRLASILGETTDDYGNDDHKHTKSSVLHPILRAYESERRPIASQNAALSVRNFNRTLDIAKACYLNADHPVLLKNLMSSPPMNLIPLHGRQQIFETLVKTAMIPLSNLANKGNLFSDRIVNNIRQILWSGGGLPLLFPRYELGFSYGNSSSLLDEGDDTAGFVPSVKVGFRLPHIPVKILSTNAGIDATQPLSLTDIESQLNKRWKNPEAPRFSIIIFDMDENFFHDFESLKESFKPEIGHQVTVVEVYSDPNLAVLRSQKCLREGNNHTVLQAMQEDHSTQVLIGDSGSNSFVAVVRPDGHVNRILFNDNNKSQI